MEVALAATILAFALVATASSFSTNLSAVRQAKGINKAARFLEETMDAVAAQPYENLLSLNGNVYYDHQVVRAARYRIGMTVFLASADLLQVRAVLTDRRTGQELARVVTYRSRR